MQDYKPTEDPSRFKSAKTGRGPLIGLNWERGVNPVMCCYKLVTVEFKWWGLQNKVEKFIHRVINIAYSVIDLTILRVKKLLVVLEYVVCGIYTIA